MSRPQEPPPFSDFDPLLDSPIQSSSTRPTKSPSAPPLQESPFPHQSLSASSSSSLPLKSRAPSAPRHPLSGNEEDGGYYGDVGGASASASASSGNRDDGVLNPFQGIQIMSVAESSRLSVSVNQQLRTWTISSSGDLRSGRLVSLRGGRLSSGAVYSLQFRKAPIQISPTEFVVGISRVGRSRSSSPSLLFAQMKMLPTPFEIEVFGSGRVKGMMWDVMLDRVWNPECPMVCCSATKNSSIQFVRLREGSPSHVGSTVHRDWVMGLCSVPWMHQTLCAGVVGRSIDVVDVERKEVVREISGVKLSASARGLECCLSRGLILGCSSLGQIALQACSPDDGEVVFALPLQNAVSVKCLPDPSLFALLSSSGVVQIRDLRRPDRYVNEFCPHYEAQREHGALSSPCVLGNDGVSLCCASVDPHDVVVWRVDGKVIHRSRCTEAAGFGLDASLFRTEGFGEVGGSVQVGGVPVALPVPDDMTREDLLLDLKRQNTELRKQVDLLQKRVADLEGN